MKISVVIPAYNAAAFLPRCLKSVFAQTLQPDQVIVVDDGSADNTAAVAEELGAQVIRRHNGGPGAARNAGIQAASNQWVALVDADDMWAPEKLERQAAQIKLDTVLVYTGVTFFDDRGVREGGPPMDAPSARKMLRYVNGIPSSSVLVKREAAMQGGGFREDVRHGEDWELWFRLMRLGQFEAVMEPLSYYYVYPNSLSADPDKMIFGLNQFIDTTLLRGMRGFNRWVWRRRIMASQLSRAGLIARDNKLASEVGYMAQSLRAWPSPFWEPRRFSILAVSLRSALRRPKRKR